MGLFYGRSKQEERGKTWIVLRAHPLANIFFVAWFLLFVSFSYLQESYVKLLGTMYRPAFWFMMGTALLLAITQGVETFEASLARIRRKTVRMEKGWRVDINNPQEIWIEK